MEVRYSLINLWKRPDHRFSLSFRLKILWGSFQQQRQQEMWKHFPQQAASQSMRQKFQSHGGAKAQEKRAVKKKKRKKMG